MTDKQIIETLENIKEYCSIRRCADCKFHMDYRYSFNGSTSCQIRALAYELFRVRPEMYRLGDIEEIIKQ